MFAVEQIAQLHADIAKLSAEIERLRAVEAHLP
jgi:uncharacterized small protein (DUF1192 family)